MSQIEQFVTLYFPLFSKTYEWNKKGFKSMSYGLTKVPNAVIIAVLNEKTILGKTYMKYYFYVASFLLFVFMVSV